MPVVYISEDLADDVADIYEDRGFNSSREFVQSAIRDAIEADDDLSEAAREQVERARRQYRTDGLLDFDDLYERLDIETDDSRMD